MNIHSVMAPSALRRSSASMPPAPKREAILRAATDVFAGRGFFNAQIADGQAAGIFRGSLNATAAAKMFFGALDEMATNWILSRRRYSLEAEADAVVDLFVNGARGR